MRDIRNWRGVGYLEIQDVFIKTIVFQLQIWDRFFCCVKYRNSGGDSLYD